MGLEVSFFLGANPYSHCLSGERQEVKTQPSGLEMVVEAITPSHVIQEGSFS